MRNDPYSKSLLDMYNESTAKTPTQDTKKLQAAARINSMAQIFNLLGQAVSLKNASIGPMQDQATPYLLNQYNQIQQTEAAQSEAERKAIRDAVDKDIQYQIDQENIKQRQDFQTSERLARQEFENTFADKYRMTPEQALSRDLTLIDARKEADIEKERIKSSNDKKVVLPVLDDEGIYGLSQEDINGLWAYMVSDPEIKKDMESRYPQFFKKDFTIESIPPQWVHARLKDYWEKVKPEYNKLQGKVSADNKTSNNAQENTGDLENEFNKLFFSGRPKSEVRQSLVDILVKAGYTKENAAKYVDDYYPNK